MNPSLSWIDPNDIIDRLSRATGRPPAAFDTHTLPLNADNDAEPPSLLDTDTAPVPAWAKPVKADTVRSDLPEYAPDDRLAQRLATFSQWLGSCAAPVGFYIADADGLPIHMENVSEHEVITGVTLARSLSPIRHLVGAKRLDAVTLHLEGGRVLQTLWSTCRVGTIGMGIEARRPLNPEELADVGRAIRRIFDNEAQTQ